MRKSIACLLGLFLAAFFAETKALTEAALKDKIVNLPDAPEDAPEMFSGYIPINADGSRRIFYWFMKSTEPSNIVAYQTNGGPGCSGLIGAFTEWSPIMPVYKDGRVQLATRKSSWNKYANVIYVEQPAGVGFSQAEGSVNWTDDEAASNAHSFLKGWFERFPEYKTNQLVLFSESYGGHYLPTLAQKLHRNPLPGINFKGFLVGNPLTYMPWRDYGEIAALAMHQRVPSYLWDQYLAKGCAPRYDVSPNPPLPTSDACVILMNKMQSLAKSLDPYALDFPVCRSGSVAQQKQFLETIREVGEEMVPARKQLRLLGQSQYFPDYNECVDNLTQAYLNRPEVQQAIHAEKPQAGKWSECARIKYSSYDMITSMVPIYEELVSSGKYKIMIYSGDNDSVCSTHGEQPWLWESKKFSIGSKNWSPWFADLDNGKQLGGYITEFNYGNGTLQFATVTGAGHMVPTTRPYQSLSLFAKYLGKETW